MTFPSQLDARQFLIDKITNQASRTATPLSEAERKMLELDLDDPESAAGIPLEMLKDDSRTYESKIAKLLQAAYSRDSGVAKEQQKYREAVLRLKNSDHYILIIAADAIPRRKNLGNYAVYIIIALAMALMIAGLQLWTHGKF